MMRIILAILLLTTASLVGQSEGWHPVSVPQEEGWDAGPGFGWYRAWIDVPASWEGSRLLLVAGQISRADEAFFNGVKVGANGSMPPLFSRPASDIRRPFVIEPDQVRFGESNLIAWRVYTDQEAGGLLRGALHLTRKDDALDLQGGWLFRDGDDPAWAKPGTDPAADAAAFRKLVGEQPAGHRGIVPADTEGRRAMLTTVSRHFEGNKNPYARADDKGQPTPAEEAVGQFELADGLALDLVLSEPLVRQPLYLEFDERGRLWVVQYIQYPNPAGLEVLTWDKHLRKVFDRVPPPPPYDRPETRRFAGADRITIHEDQDGDGVFDTHRTFLEGLNMVTSLAHGHGGVWVLQPPYLLFYPDTDRDDVPDRDPVVHLSGFNLEDTHSISNSLKFGPDGWLYGCTGSTVTARVRTHLGEDDIRHSFFGQNIWRYHPEEHRFELFAEGGWNNFGVDFDAAGRLYSGTNGTLQAVHFVQGGYYQKNFGKHGPHTNPYTFGHFGGIPVKGERIRLVHQWLRYEDGAIPSLASRLVGGNSLGNKLHALRIEPHGSTFRSVEEASPIRTADKWFRPVHCTTGPDGAIYIADFYDARITHVDPRDNWDRSNGRVYRLRAREATARKAPDLRELDAPGLVSRLRTGNQWERRHARRLLGELPAQTLRDTLGADPSARTVEELWALHAAGALRAPDLRTALRSNNPDLRRWALRLLGERPTLASQPAIRAELGRLAVEEKSPEVISQLLSTLQRHPADQVAELLPELARRGEFADDPFVPQQLWWAMESLVTRSPRAARATLEYAGFWEAPLFQQVIRERIGRRYLAERSDESIAMCAFLLGRAAGTEHLDPLIRGMEKALEGTALDPVPPALDAALATIWDQHRVTDDLIRFSLRLKSPRALAAARPLVSDAGTPLDQRLAFLTALAELRDSKSRVVFLELFRNDQVDGRLRLAALNALRRYGGEEIPEAILALYPNLEGDLRLTAQSVLAGRPAWAHLLLTAVDRGEIAPDTIALDAVLLMRSHEHEATAVLLDRHWGDTGRSSKDKADRIRAIKALLTTPGAEAKPARGKEVFARACAACHRLRGHGREIAPDLTGYEMDNLDYLVPAIVDPNLGIREGYELVTLTLRAREGESAAVLSGFLIAADRRSLTLRDLAGNRNVIARSDLAGETRSPVSVMPEGLLDALSEQEIRDLFAYLRSR